MYQTKGNHVLNCIIQLSPENWKAGFVVKLGRPMTVSWTTPLSYILNIFVHFLANFLLCHFLPFFPSFLQPKFIWWAESYQFYTRLRLFNDQEISLALFDTLCSAVSCPQFLHEKQVCLQCLHVYI